MNNSKKEFQGTLFGLLWFLGMAGVLSLLMMQLPVLPDTELPPLPVLKLLMLIQPTILLSIAVWVGVKLADAVQLSAPLAEAIIRRTSLISVLQPQLLSGILGGIAGGFLLVTLNMLGHSVLPPDFLAVEPPPFIVRLLYGGITEEILLRWGFMTFLVWLAWRFIQRRQGNPKNYYVAIAIIFSAILFGVAHLPVVMTLGTRVTLALITYIVIANTVFGLIAGYLYWKRGLEAAMIAHMMTHVIMALVAM